MLELSLGILLKNKIIHVNKDKTYSQCYNLLCVLFHLKKDLSENKKWGSMIQELVHF